MSVTEAVSTPKTVAVAPAPPAVPAPAAGRSAAQIYSAALLTLGVAGIHFAAAAGHLAEYLPYGIFFIGLGLAQVALAVAIVVAPSTRLFLAAALGTAAVIALWFVSRITGLPIAPDPWRPEIPGMLDMFATLTEIISVVLFLLLARTPHKPKARGRVRVALSTLPAVPLAALAGWMAVGSALHPMPAAFNTAPAVAGQPSTSVADLVAAPGSEPLKVFTLTAGVVSIEGHQAWAYNGTVPGPELRVVQGDRVRVTLVNCPTGRQSTGTASACRTRRTASPGSPRMRCGPAARTSTSSSPPMWGPTGITPTRTPTTSSRGGSSGR